MKKQLLVITTGLLLAMSAKAQITVTSTDVAGQLMLIRQAHDTMTTVSVGSAGTNQTWDLSGLNTHTEDSLLFIPPSWAPGSNLFPTANLAIKTKQLGADAYIYANKNTNSTSFLGNVVSIDIGSGTPIQITQHNNPSELLMNFPSTYNSTYTVNYTTKALDTVRQNINSPLGTIYVDSIMMSSSITKTSLCDGWGAVTTPISGTPFNALRFETVKMSADTVWAYIGAWGGWIEIQNTLDTTKTYTWWANSVGYALAEVRVDYSTGVPESADWLEVAPTVGINEYNNSLDATIYPNPAQNTLYIATKADKTSAVQLFDINGKELQSITVNNDISVLDISGLANGIYTYSILGKDRSVVTRGKFSVIK